MKAFVSTAFAGLFGIALSGCESIQGLVSPAASTYTITTNNTFKASKFEIIDDEFNCYKEFNFKPDFSIEPPITGSVIFTNTPVELGSYKETEDFTFTVVDGKPINESLVYLWQDKDKDPIRYAAVCSVKSPSNYKMNLDSAVITVFPSAKVEVSP